MRLLATVPAVTPFATFTVAVEAVPPGQRTANKVHDLDSDVFGEVFAANVRARTVVSRPLIVFSHFGGFSKYTVGLKEKAGAYRVIYIQGRAAAAFGIDGLEIRRRNPIRNDESA